MTPDNKRFLDMHGVITGREAKARYPDPVFFMRPRPSLTLDECRAILHRNCDEAAQLVEMLRATAGHKSKAPILGTANDLHNFRVSINMHGGERGRPFLWEE